MTVVKVNGLRTPEQRATVTYVGRAFAGWPASKWGNPHKVGRWTPEAAGAAVKLFRAHAASQPPGWLAELWEACAHGAKPLGCWCLDWDGTGPLLPLCHAAVLAEELNLRFVDLPTPKE